MDRERADNLEMIQKMDGVLTGDGSEDGLPAAVRVIETAIRVRGWLRDVLTEHREASCREAVELCGSILAYLRHKWRLEVAKRQRVERENGLVIVSNVGDTRPEEIVPDTLATYCLNCGMSVRSYVVVSDFAMWPMFLANWERKADVEEGIVAKRYVKKMIPRTMCLKNITCDVMMLFCHGIPKFVDNDGVHHPHALCFNEDYSVNRDGERRYYVPRSSQIWSCSEYKDEKVTYKKRVGGVTLSEVVWGSRLVVLLCCCGGPIMQEYRAEMVGKGRPDFVYFAMDHSVHDISINIFLALLITALERATERGCDWDEFFRRCVCQVLRWVFVYGTGDDDNADTFWTFLEDMDCIEMRGENRERFRIKGCINNYGLEMNPGLTEDGKKKPDDKQIVLQELQSVTLLLWDGGERVVDHTTDKAQLDEWIRGTPFRQASHGGRVQSPISVDALLLQLKCLLCVK